MGVRASYWIVAVTGCVAATALHWAPDAVFRQPFGQLVLVQLPLEQVCNVFAFRHCVAPSMQLPVGTQPALPAVS